METAEKVAIKPYMNEIGYSDVNPWEVIKIVSDKTVEIRAMKATEEPWDKTFIPGGFCGTFINQSQQKWKIEPDPSGEVIRVRLGKRGWWNPKHGGFSNEDAPRKFYDFNF